MKINILFYKKENDIFYFAVSKENNISFLEEQMHPFLSYGHQDFYQYLEKIEKPCHLVPFSFSWGISHFVENWLTFSQIRAYLHSSHEKRALLMAIQYLASGGMPDECSAAEFKI